MGDRRSARRNRRRSAGRGRDERGFTLIELLIVLSILPIVVGAVAVSMISSFRNEHAVSVRVADSHDAQITSAYFVRDVQAASSISTSPTAVCGSQPQLLGLSWTSGNKLISVSYAISSSGASPFLVRNYCAGTAAPISTIVSNNAFIGLPSPTVSNSCNGTVSSCAVSDGHTGVSVMVVCQDGTTTCANGGLTATFPSSSSPGVTKVVLRIHENSSAFFYTLTGVPRNQATQVLEPPGSAGPPLVLLGTSNPALTCDNKTGVVVNGAVAVNSTSPGSLSFGPHATLQATQVYSETLSPQGAVVTPPSAYTGPTVQGPAFPDPYAGLPDPTSSTVHSGNTIAGPGVYTSAITVTSAVNLSPGVYIFEQGLSISGSSAVQLTGSGVTLFIGIPNASQGTAQTAGFSVIGNATVNIAAPITGTYAGIAIFQSRTDSTPMTIAGNGTNNSYGGAIYAPDASVSTSGNGSAAAGSVVAGALSCGGNGNISVGFAVISSAPQQSPITVGQSNADVVSIVGAPGRGAPQGTITFYVCDPSVALGSCSSSTGTQVGSAVTLTPGANNTSTATSQSSPYTAPGTWCFVEYFGGDPNYGPSSDTSLDGCFVVDGPALTVSFPKNGGTYSSGSGNGSWTKADGCATTDAICGTATDVGGTISGVQFSVAKSGGGCWDGSDWTGSCPHWLPTTLNPSGSASTAWTSTSWSAANFTPGTYTLTARTTDSNGVTASTSVTFTIT